MAVADDDLGVLTGIDLSGGVDSNGADTERLQVDSTHTQLLQRFLTQENINPTVKPESLLATMSVNLGLSRLLLRID